MTEARAEGERRRYRSPRREQQAAETRALVLAAATELFAERGWSGTGMREVAKRAGVSIETVYNGFRSKTELLLAAIDVGVVGDTTPTPLSGRPEFAALGTGGFDERAGAAARLLSGINRRTWGLRQAMGEASVSEPEIAAKVRELEQRRRSNVRVGAELMLGRAVDDDELDALWALLGAEVYYLLTHLGDRSVEAYEAWLTTVLHRLFDGTRAEVES